MNSPLKLEKPQRWDTPFDERMDDRAVNELLQIDPFASMDEQAFGTNVPLRGLLKNDCRITNYQDGEIVIREGDYGNSAFLILSGELLVSLDSLPANILGRATPKKKNFFQTLAQGWTNSKHSEVRNYSDQNSDCRISNAEDRARIFIQDVPRVITADRSETLQTGEFFGELAALTRSPRTATVVSKGNARVLEVRWQGLRDLMKRDSALKNHIDQIYREFSLKSHLRETDLLQSLSEDQIEKIAAETCLETFGNFDWQVQFKAAQKKDIRQRIHDEPVIAERGEYPNGLILIRNGFCRLSRPYGNGHQTISYLGKGETFGFRELAHNWQTGQQRNWSLSLRAVGYVDILRIPTFAVEQFVFPNIPSSKLPALLPAAGTISARSSDQQKKKRRGSPVNSDLLEFLMDHRFINGTQAMMIDMNRCTRCDDCVRACASTHDNNPRFVRQGKQHDNFMIAGACMHCVDPVCMIGCPTGAIGRDQNTGYVTINDNTCIGCSTCANSCPYQNIRMVNVRDSKGNPMVDTHSGEPIAKATKCDLCSDQQGGPACQRACPHDALYRIDLSDSEQLEKWFG